MRRYTEMDCKAERCFEVLSEECQLDLNGGCTSNTGITINDIAHSVLIMYDIKEYGHHLQPCPYCN